MTIRVLSLTAAAGPASATVAWFTLAGALGGVLVTSIVGLSTAMLNHRWQDQQAEVSRRWQLQDADRQLQQDRAGRHREQRREMCRRGRAYGTRRQRRGLPEPQRRHARRSSVTGQLLARNRRASAAAVLFRPQNVYSARRNSTRANPNGRPYRPGPVRAHHAATRGVDADAGLESGYRPLALTLRLTWS
jgi:hypothetical protein